jgi:hypothetical protein
MQKHYKVDENVLSIETARSMQHQISAVVKSTGITRGEVPDSLCANQSFTVFNMHYWLWEFGIVQNTIKI